jgi:hypothetical protein
VMHHTQVTCQALNRVLGPLSRLNHVVVGDLSSQFDAHWQHPERFVSVASD